MKPVDIEELERELADGPSYADYNRIANALIQEVRELRAFARSVFAFLPDDQVDAYATEARRLGLLEDK